eukprot:CAMPEP_0172603968 /NCGR_PEP_ID=MMETSP1068-20121228/24194_1 /TAXON_ID=35684 /ORGANISM="Pseudopedinella elastica, Strain CCMP716" /LENGTH=197 /DNA_ID=CAMNT_0013405867 /DNA_START=262 /DNA_END=855 /DNA_ORIENTATION=-
MVPQLLANRSIFRLQPGFTRSAHGFALVELESVRAKLLADRAPNLLRAQFVLAPEGARVPPGVDQAKLGQDVVKPEQLAYPNHSRVDGGLDLGVPDHHGRPRRREAYHPRGQLNREVDLALEDSVPDDLVARRGDRHRAVVVRRDDSLKVACRSNCDALEWRKLGQVVEGRLEAAGQVPKPGLPPLLRSWCHRDLLI